MIPNLIGWSVARSVGGSLAKRAAVGYAVTKSFKTLAGHIPGTHHALVNGRWDQTVETNIDGSFVIYWDNGGYTRVDSSGQDKRGRHFTIRIQT